MIINKNKVSASIWIMLPVFMLAAFITILSSGSPLEAIGGAFMVLGYSAIIWIPSMIFTFIMEMSLLNETSTKTHVAGIFATETLLTFIIIAAIFGDFSMGIPMLALGLSVIIQLLRWFYLISGGRMFKPGREADENSEIL